jgi:hypothetical protein
MLLLAESSGQEKSLFKSRKLSLLIVLKASDFYVVRPFCGIAMTREQE